MYEEEAPLFFEDRSDEIIGDDVFARLLIFPNVLDHRPPGVLHPRGARGDRRDTLGNVADFAAGRDCANEVRAPAR